MNEVERTIRALERLVQGPATPKELAEEFKLSARQLQRFMKELTKAGVPVYLRKTALEPKPHWWLDTDKYIARLNHKKS